MNERIKQVRKHNKLNQNDFGEILGISRDAVANIELGRVAVSEIILKSVSREFDVNYEWLAFGTGEMKKTEDDAQSIIDAVMTSDNEFIKSSLVKLASLDKKYWDMIEEIIEELKKL